MPDNKVFFTPYGAVGAVTGANFLLENNQRRLLVDCGLLQGCKFCEDDNRKPFAYNPASIDALIVTHAHIDHVGRIPKLVRDGFHGTIYSTPDTREIAAIMLEDSLGVLTKEARGDGVPPIYGEDDVGKALALWKPIAGIEETDLGGGFRFVLKDAGHIL